MRDAPRHALAAFAAMSRSDVPDIDRVVLAGCSAALFVVASWLAIGILVSATAAVPGTVGAAAARVSSLLVPQVLRRVLAGATGLGVVLTPACAGALTPEGSGPGHHAGAGAVALVHAPPANSGAIPAPTWPTGTAATSIAAPATSTTESSAPAAAPGAGPTTHPSVPTTGPGAAPRSAAPSATPATPPAPQITARPAAPPESPPPAPLPPSTSPTTSTCTVVPGDSLWSIAARRLGKGATATRVAHYWPRVYAHNSSVVGDDPSLIHPGQRLTLPTPTNEELPT